MLDFMNGAPRKKRQLTVGQLIVLLGAFPADALVFHEGCDCIGDADRVEDFSFTEDGELVRGVLIGRNN